MFCFVVEYHENPNWFEIILCVPAKLKLAFYAFLGIWQMVPRVFKVPQNLVFAQMLADNFSSAHSCSKSNRQLYFRKFSLCFIRYFFFLFSYFLLRASRQDNLSSRSCNTMLAVRTRQKIWLFSYAQLRAFALATILKRPRVVSVQARSANFERAKFLKC